VTKEEYVPRPGCSDFIRSFDQRVGELLNKAQRVRAQSMGKQNNALFTSIVIHCENGNLPFMLDFTANIIVLCVMSLT
jgi:hypothetical protein